MDSGGAVAAASGDEAAWCLQSMKTELWIAIIPIPRKNALLLKCISAQCANVVEDKTVKFARLQGYQKNKTDPLTRLEIRASEKM
jgi:hypothetical protein